VKKETAIAKLTSQGMTAKEANAEFNGKVNYYMRGTMHTAAEKAYAVECAIDDIMDECADDVDDFAANMLQAMHG
jgi:hypothetical protein